jgi:DNA-binding NarL/FixJ family response regulator
MRQNELSDLMIPETEPPNLPAVLSKFQVDGNQFFIMSLETKSNTQSVLDESALLSQNYVEVGRFQVQGQIFAIVKLEQATSAEPIELGLIALLTERELQIVTLVASGQVNKQIANQLCISEWTVSTHLRRIFIKLGVDSRAAMVYLCAPVIQKLHKEVKTSQRMFRR